ncbi:MAG TPA: hypothetical protein VFB45_03275 [Pseudolabrys sp.]|nr:hypothetical protein [Pseudolabrys sp.]
MALNSSKQAAQARAENSFKRKELRQREGQLATAEYEAVAVAMREKTARLRELREAKEAVDRDAAANAAPARQKISRKT